MSDNIVKPIPRDLINLSDKKTLILGHTSNVLCFHLYAKNDKINLVIFSEHDNKLKTSLVDIKSLDVCKPDDRFYIEVYDKDFKKIMNDHGFTVSFEDISQGAEYKYYAKTLEDLLVTIN